MPTLDPTSIRVPTNERPTIFNKDAGLGWFLGSVAGSATFFLTGGLGGLAMIAASSIIGGLWGGIAGKRRMARELTEGAPVHKPTFFNRNIFSGMFFVDLLAIAATIGSVLYLGPQTLLENPPMLEGLSKVLLFGYGVAAFSSAVAGGVYGSEKQAERYAKAEKFISRIPELGMAPQRNIEYQITPQERAMLTARMRQSGQGQSCNFSQQVEESRQQQSATGLIPAS
jgi:hypothetical protein